MRFQIIIVLIFMTTGLYSQEYKSAVFRNDTLTERGTSLVFDDDHFYVNSSSRCAPNAQGCGIMRQFNSQTLQVNWRTELPFQKLSNENSISIYDDSTIFSTGFKNLTEQPNGFSLYTLDLDGFITNYSTLNLPNESNFSYSSLLNKNKIYFSGSTDGNGPNPEIDVDAIIASYTIQDSSFEYEYFDYDKNTFVEAYNLNSDINNDVIFFSRRKNEAYESGQRDLVIERIQSDGGRIDLYSMMVENDDIGQLPKMTVLSNGNIVFQILDANLSGNSWRVISKDGNYLFDINFGAPVFHPDRFEVWNISKTNDGGFLAVGRYVDKTEIINGSIEFNSLIMKVNGNGDLEWIRNYRNTHEDTGEYAESNLSAVMELPNGDIVATGSVTQESSDLIVLKVDNKGCLGENDCGELTTSTTEVLFEKNNVNIWPNPIAHNSFQVEVSSQLKPPFQLKIYDQSGRTILIKELETRKEFIQFSDGQVNGMLFYQLTKNGKAIHSDKIIKY